MSYLTFAVVDHDRTRWLRIARRLAASAVFIAFCGTNAAYALGLGEIAQQSSLGEPLRIVIPVLVNADDLAGNELSPECFKLTTESPRAPELPQVPFGRVTLERSERGFHVVVTTNRAVNDPIVSIVVQAGCNLTLRREYTVLLDPPLIAEPVAESRPPATAAAAPASVAAAPRAAAAAGDTGVRRPAGRTGARRAGGASGAGDVGAAMRRAPKAAAKGETTTVKPPAAAQASPTPQLRVSRGMQERTAMTDVAQAQSQQEMAQAVEAETVVLQRRVAELSATLERMQAELRETRNALELAQRTAKPALAAGPDPSVWVLLVALLLVASLLGVMFARSRRSAPLYASGPPTIMEPDAIEPPSSRVAPLRTAPLAGSPATSRSVPGIEEGIPSSAADPEVSFEEDLIRTAARRSDLSALEREHPRLLARLIGSWGKPKVIGELREILISPRVATGALSREAVSELTLLQDIAMGTAGYKPDDDPWRVPIND